MWVALGHPKMEPEPVPLIHIYNQIIQCVKIRGYDMGMVGWISTGETT